MLSHIVTKFLDAGGLSVASGAVSPERFNCDDDLKWFFKPQIFYYVNQNVILISAALHVNINFPKRNKLYVLNSCTSVDSFDNNHQYLIQQGAVPSPSLYIRNMILIVPAKCNL